MPTYQYACTACNERLEVVQKFTDDPLTACPTCDGRLRKVFSAVGVVFKGSGFYRTDSRAAVNGAKNGKSGESGKNGSSTSGSSANSSESANTSSTTKSDKTTASAPAA